jgi:hypothetical protein
MEGQHVNDSSASFAGAAAALDAQLQASGQRLDGRPQSRAAFVAGKVRRHLEWARRDGIARLVEEDELDPRGRVARAWSKARWRHQHGVEPGQARAVFLVGLQRSGTNMLTRGLDTAPEFQVHNENDRQTFSRYRLRDDAAERRVLASRHRFVLFKPLCDSHRVPELLERNSRPGAPAAALWAFRDPDGRARSAVAKFGDNDRVVLQALNAGVADNLWQTQGLTDAVRAEIATFDVARLSPESASGLFWWARNSLYFDLALDGREDVVLVSYGQFLADAAAQMRAVCATLDLPYRPSLVAGMDDRAHRSPRRLDLHPRVRVLCDDLLERLEDGAARQIAASARPAADALRGSSPVPKR